MLSKILTVLVMFFFLPVNAFAVENCNNPQTQLDMNICSHLSFKKADEQLNKTYQKALRQDSSEQFREVQRAWVKYRDLNCNHQSAAYEGGSIKPLIHASCMEKLTIERTKEIPNFFNEWKFDKWERSRNAD